MGFARNPANPAKTPPTCPREPPKTAKLQFGKTMKLHGYGRVKAVAYDQNNVRYLIMDWADQEEIIEVPLMGANSTVDIRTIEAVEDVMPEKFYKWLSG